jgi:hypothetical protein
MPTTEGFLLFPNGYDSLTDEDFSWNQHVKNLHSCVLCLLYVTSRFHCLRLSIIPR